MVLGTSCICDDMYIWCCVHIVRAMLCTYGVVYMLDMQCCVHMALWACGYVVLCTYGVVCMLYMWGCVHVVYVELCTRCAGGVVCMLYM